MATTASVTDFRKTSVWDNRKSILICALIGTASFQYGFDQGMIGGFQAMVGFLEVFGYKDPSSPAGFNLTVTVQQLISSLMTLGAFIGALSAGPMGGYINRRWSIFVGSVACVASLLIMIFTTNLGALYFGRLLLGVANGIYMTAPQLYIHESTPPHWRGAMLVMFQFWISLGSTIGTIVVNYTAPLSGRISYQIPLCLLFLVPVLLTIVSPFIPDSPRWFLSHDKSESALNALRRLRGNHYDQTLVAAEFQEIREAWAIEKELARSASIFDMFRGTDLRRTVLSVLAVCMQGASGSMFVIIYGTYFFLISGSTKPFQDSIIVSCIGLASVMGMIGFTRYLARRKILLTGSAMQAISMLIIAIVYTVAASSTSALTCLVAFVCVYTFFYIGWVGPMAWVVAGEIPSTRLRSYTLGLGAGIGFFIGWLVAFTAPYFINSADLNWGPKYGYIWFVTNLINMIFIFFFLPEMKDRTLEEIDELFHNRVPARKFSGYQCVVAQQARENGVEKIGERDFGEVEIKNE